MKRYFLIIFISVVFYGSEVFGQLDPLYSQYMFNQLALNPAYAGSRDVLSIYTLVRSQWTGLGAGQGAPGTQVLSAHAPLKNKKIGWGVQLVSDQIGPEKNSGAFVSYAYRMRMKNARLALGMRIGTYTYRYGELRFKDEEDYAPYRQSHFRSDFGVYYNSKTWYWGWSVIHLADINTSGSNYLPTVQRFFTLGKAFRASGNLVINPSLLLKNAENTRNLDVNVNFLVRNKFWFGISARGNNTIPLLFEYIASENLRIGVSRDIPAGRIIRRLGPSTELLLQWDIKIRKAKTLTPRYL